MGAVQRYFEFINQDNKESTNDTYMDFYNNNIFPYVNHGKPVESFDIDYVDDLIRKIQQKNENDMVFLWWKRKAGAMYCPRFSSVLLLSSLQRCRLEGPVWL